MPPTLRQTAVATAIPARNKDQLLRLWCNLLLSANQDWSARSAGSRSRSRPAAVGPGRKQTFRKTGTRRGPSRIQLSNFVKAWQPGVRGCHAPCQHLDDEHSPGHNPQRGARANGRPWSTTTTHVATPTGNRELRLRASALPLGTAACMNCVVHKVTVSRACFTSRTRRKAKASPKGRCSCPTQPQLRCPGG